MTRKSFAAFVTTFCAFTACGPHQQTGTQGSRSSNPRESASADSAVYAAFLETVGRDPRRDTIYVGERSAEFPGISPHDDSMIPGLSLALKKVSTPTRPTASLHLPPPIRVLPDTIVQRIDDLSSLGQRGDSNGRARVPRGLWTFSPVAYSPDGNDARFTYMFVCGSLCGGYSFVWAARDPPANGSIDGRPWWSFSSTIAGSKPQPLEHRDQENQLREE